jgi:hypothetical protein
MRMEKRDARAPIRLALLACLLLVSCNNTFQPVRDVTPPVADLRLSLWNAEELCPFVAIFSVNPVGSTDDRTDYNLLEVRWDFDDDGIWDSEFGPLDMEAWDPGILPVGIWTARCEVRDLGGNTDQATASMTLPEWLPEPPDIASGEMLLSQAGRGSAPDTLTAGLDFTVNAFRQDWVIPAAQHMITALYIDGVLVHETAALSVMPSRGMCPRYVRKVVGGIATPGLHELQVVVDAHHEITETDEGNNTTTRQVVIVAP